MLSTVRGFGVYDFAENVLLFFDAEVVKTADSQPNRTVRSKPADLGFVEMSNVELFQRRLGHPGCTAMNNLVRLQKIPPPSFCSYS
jgi:hypothetical protein